MASNVALLFVLLSASAPAVHANTNGNSNAAANADASADTGNPIRKVVQMLQMMSKKVEEEGKKEKELFDKFVCYCKNGAATLGQSIADNNAKVPQLQSDIEAAEQQLETTKQELAQHQTERDAAKEAMAKATAIREKEHAVFVKDSDNLKANIGALDKAIPAIETGMGGGFLQTDAAKLLRRVALSDDDLTDFDREQLVAFMQGSSAGNEGYVPKSGQIVGILKQMHDEFSKDLAELVAQEEAAVKTYDELMAAKTKEVEAHTAAIERKTVLVGELSVEIVNMKNDLTDSEEALIEDQKFLADLDKNCDAKKKEWEERQKLRSQELVALAETIKILNDDDALELFKKTLPSPSLLQIRAGIDKVQTRALQYVKSIKQQHHSYRPDLDLIALALTGKKVDFSKVIKMIDDMVVLLGKEQADDDHKKEYCAGQLDFTDDKMKELGHTISDLDTQIADTQEMLKTLEEELKALADGIVALDKSVQEATIQRKKENEEYTELMASNTAAKQLIEFAKNRMNKFYNPKLYKPPPKRELTEEERISLNMGGTMAPTAAPGGIAGTGVTVLTQSKHQDAPPPPPETFGEYSKKSEESNGVIGMMDLLIRDLDKEMTEAETEEKNSQEEYEEMMDDSAAKRADDSKAITEKESAKAEAEEDLTTAKGAKATAAEELGATKEYDHQLHAECDWLLENFEVRKTARAEEVSALKNAKAVLAGADFSFAQQQLVTLRRH
jgi:prefoldin subunit 5